MRAFYFLELLRERTCYEIQQQLPPSLSLSFSLSPLFRTFVRYADERSL